MGTSGRDQYYGPGLVNFDLTAQKDFPVIRERVKLNFRADLFNVFNHTNFSNPHRNRHQFFFWQDNLNGWKRNQRLWRGTRRSATRSVLPAP